MVLEHIRRFATFGTIPLLASVTVDSATGGTSGLPATSESVLAAIARTMPLLQSGDGNTVAAVLAVVVLAVLGGALVVRNRLDVGAESTTNGSSTADDEVVTDRERVRRLITENGGRMKQSEIVDSVEWSKAKVSRLLADLESDDEITKLRLGRENLICLPGNEPTASQSSDRKRE